MATNNNSALGIGLGVAAAAAAAAGGAYWLYGAKHSAQHRKMAKSWMLKARAEVLEAIEKLDEIDKEKYMGIVEGVVKNYAKGASREDLERVMKEFKGAWTHMQGKKKVKKVASKAKRAVKKGTKKAKSSR
jgi:hypothetical protein